MTSKLSKKFAVYLFLLEFLLVGCSANILEAENTPFENSLEKEMVLCKTPPVINALGQERYPSEEKYAHLEFLGPLFTAYSCGAERIALIPGVVDGRYGRGLSILTEQSAPKTLVSIFEALDFQCLEKKEGEICEKWFLEEPISVNQLMKLEPYHSNFKADHCRECFR